MEVEWLQLNQQQQDQNGLFYQHRWGIRIGQIEYGV